MSPGYRVSNWQSTHLGEGEKRSGSWGGTGGRRCGWVGSQGLYEGDDGWVDKRSRIEQLVPRVGNVSDEAPGAGSLSP